MHAPKLSKVLVRSKYLIGTATVNLGEMYYKRATIIMHCYTSTVSRSRHLKDRRTRGMRWMISAGCIITSSDTMMPSRCTWKRISKPRHQARYGTVIGMAGPVIFHERGYQCSHSCIQWITQCGHSYECTDEMREAYDRTYQILHPKIRL